jgi:hypothetical protein
MTNRTTNLAALIAAVVAAVSAGGCHDKPRDSRVDGKTFRPEGEARAVNRIGEAQMAAGARTDATIRAYDYDCTDLNSLGRHKLDLMLKDDDTCTPIVVYLDVPHEGNDGQTYDARQESVRGYLKNRGLTDNQIRVVAGPNVYNLGPTAPALRAKKLLDVGAAVAVNPEPAGSPGPSGK